MVESCEKTLSGNDKQPKSINPLNKIGILTVFKNKKFSLNGFWLVLSLLQSSFLNQPPLLWPIKKG